MATALPQSRRPVYAPGKRISAARPVRRATYTAPQPPALRTADEPVPDPTLPADTLTATPGTSAARQRRATYNPPSGKGVDDVAPTTRPRRATYTPPPPPGFAEAAQQVQELLTSPVEDKNGRLRSGGTMALASINAGGQPPSSLAQLAGRLIGGFVGGAVFNKSDEQLHRQNVELPQARARAELAAAQEKAKRETEMHAADIRLKNANATYAEARPDLEAQKRADAAALREYNSVLSLLRLYKNQKLDPANARHAKLLERAANTGIEVDTDAWNEAVAAGRAAYFDEVDPNNPTVKRRVTLERGTANVAPVMDGGQPAQTGYVAPIHADTEMTATQEHTDSDRDAARTETGRHNRATEAQGGERIGISRDNAAHRGEPTATSTNSRLARAAELARRLEDEKNRAAHPPQMIEGQPTSESYRRAYTERHLTAARGYAQSITDAYGDLYEAGAGDGGFPYAKPRQAPVTGAPGGGGAQPARPRIRQVNIGAAVDDLIKAGRFKDKQSAEAYVRQHMDVIP